MKIFLSIIFLTLLFATAGQPAAAESVHQREARILIDQLVQMVAAQDLSRSSRIATAKAYVRSKLRDPGSAVFRALAIHPGYACGYVSAKNGFGGYGEAMRFFVPGYAMVMFEEGDHPEFFNSLWQKYCNDQTA